MNRKKKCYTCKKELLLEDFRWSTKKTYKNKRSRTASCNKCLNKNRNKRARQIRKQLNEYKKNLKCIDCGNDDYRVLQFHHHTPSNKGSNVSRLAMNGSSFKKIKEEIDKCEVLCSNCHIIKHFEERNKK